MICLCWARNLLCFAELEFYFGKTNTDFQGLGDSFNRRHILAMKTQLVSSPLNYYGNNILYHQIGIWRNVRWARAYLLGMYIYYQPQPRIQRPRDFSLDPNGVIYPSVVHNIRGQYQRNVRRKLV